MDYYYKINKEEEKGVICEIAEANEFTKNDLIRSKKCKNTKHEE